MRTVHHNIVTWQTLSRSIVGPAISGVVWIALVTMAFANGEPTSAWQENFKEANRLYDEGRFTEAAAVYEGLIRDGWVAPEIFFNLGNACFKAGKFGAAILNYRRAWYLAPRDPDIRANLQYALQTAGAPAPDLKSYERLLTQLSYHQWVTLAIAFWWGTCVLSAAAVWNRRMRPYLFRGVVLSFAVLMVAMAGIGTWRQFAVRPEHVVVVTRQEVRFAPLDSAVLHFVLNEGAIVREVERSGAWLKISVDRKEGWVPSSGLTPVYAQERDPFLF